MADFPLPSNNPSAPEFRLGSDETSSYNVIKNTFEGNYLAVRKKTSRARALFNLKYDNITAAEFTILQEHFDAHVGTIFNFVHPVSGITYEVTYSDPTLSKTYKSFNIVDSTIKLESI